jgi:hypothetical protein
MNCGDSFRRFSVDLFAGFFPKDRTARKMAVSKNLGIFRKPGDNPSKVNGNIPRSSSLLCDFQWIFHETQPLGSPGPP